MSREAQLGPAWLIGLLVAWNRRETRDSGLGYYRVNPMLRDGIPTPARSYEPTGYGGAEIEAVGREVGKLDELHRAAVLRYCRPWMARAIDAEFAGTAAIPGLWLALVRDGLSQIEAGLSARTARMAAE